MELMNLLTIWIVSAFILYATAVIVPGFRITSFGRAMIGAIVVGLFNATIWWVLFILTIPLTILTLGLFTFAINAIVLRLAAGMMKGFEIRGWIPALLGAFVISFLQIILNAILY